MLKDRILQFIEYKGISKNKFYNQTGISNGTLDKKSGLTMESVEKFYSTYEEINPEWILTGHGEMLKNVQELKKNEIEKVVKQEKQLSIEEKLSLIIEQNQKFQDRLDDLESCIFGGKIANKKFSLEDIYLLIEDVETKQETHYAIINNILTESKILEFLDSLDLDKDKRKSKSKV